jgi:chromosome partitioning protein
VERLSIMPASPELAGAEIELVGVEGREFRLRQALQTVQAGFDAIVVDCPPSLGLLTLNGLGAASSVLIPLQCEFFALEGITQLMRTVERVARGLNPGLQIVGIVLTMVDRRNNLAEQVEADARSFFKDLVLETVIPRNVRLSEAPSHGKPVGAYDRASAGAQAYAKLTQEVRRRLERVSA